MSFYIYCLELKKDRIRPIAVYVHRIPVLAPRFGGGFVIGRILAPFLLESAFVSPSSRRKTQPNPTLCAIKMKARPRGEKGRHP